MVIWGHCILHLQNGQFDKWENPLYRFICSFHMPLFMTISGYFSSSILKMDFKGFITKKFRQLLLPALTFGVLFIISWLFIVRGDGSIFKLFFSSYWFLKCAFICTSLFYFACMVPNKKVGIIITLLLSQAITFKVSYLYPTFLIGVWLYEKRTILAKNCWKIFCSSLIVFLFLFSFDTYEMAAHKISFEFLNSHIVYSGLIAKLLIHLFEVLIGSVGSLTVISLFIGLGKIIPSTKSGTIIVGWGSLTLGIYLLQAIILEHWMMVAFDFSKMDWFVFNFILTPLLSVLVLIVCVMIVKLLRRRAFPRKYLLGELR